MTIIIHGDDVSSSVKKLDEFLQKNWTVRLDAKKASVDEIEKSFQTDSLFDEKRTIIVENLKGISKDVQEALIQFSNLAVSSVQLILYSPSAIDARLIKKFSNPQVFEYQLPKVYFQFLDGLTPGNAKLTHNLLTKLSQSYTAEQVFYSVVKRVRQLLMLKTNDYRGFDEIAKMGEWQLGKLKKQAYTWDREELVHLYKKLYELEKGLKTSTLPSNLLSHIDILLVSEL